MHAGTKTESVTSTAEFSSGPLRTRISPPWQQALPEADSIEFAHDLLFDDREPPLPAANGAIATAPATTPTTAAAAAAPVGYAPLGAALLQSCHVPAAHAHERETVPENGSGDE